MAPFVKEQMEALCALGVECYCFLVQGKGVSGYLRQLKPLKNKISTFHPDVVHAHFGLCGLLANLQRKIPVVTSYHGSDINDKKVLLFSKLAMHLSAWNTFVSRKTIELAKPKKKYALLPCGIDFSELQLADRQEARRQMNLLGNRHYVLFSGAFDNAVKNAPLAKEAVALLGDDNVELLELKGYSRDEVTLLMCAADALLMTSVSEGSPQVIKEAMACGCPIVSVDVGDVKERIESVEGCYVAKTSEPKELAELLRKALSFDEKTKGREKLLADGLDNQQVARRLVEIYETVLK
jgi:glycosyltransferase involved in cell wall biosynthesis